MIIRPDFNETRDTLKRANIKVTLPRMAIFQILKQSSQGMTVYDIENALIEIDNRINLATVYATLKLFQNTGLIQRYKIDYEQAIYSLTTSEGSIRITCDICGSVEYITDQAIEKQITQLCGENKLKLSSSNTVINVTSCVHCHIKPS